MGEPIADEGSLAPTAERLGEAEVEASYLTRVLPRVGGRDHRVGFLTFMVPVPAPEGGPARIRQS
jgi:hypothetical protein